MGVAVDWQRLLVEVFLVLLPGQSSAAFCGADRVDSFGLDRVPQRFVLQDLAAWVWWRRSPT